MEKSRIVNDVLFSGSLSADAITTEYDNWAKTGNYLKDLCPVYYKGPEITAKAVASLYNEDHRDNINILDIAAGTGFVAEQLQIHGFKRIDALDPSKGMLEVAKKKKLYRCYTCSYLENGVLTDRNGFYDCITVSGGFGQGHLPVSALHDMIRLTKQGGYIVIAMREEYLKNPCYDKILEPMMYSLEKDNKWEVIQRKQVSEYSFGRKGILYIFKML